MNAGRRTRFAPAPTGFLHLGHVVNAIHVWGLAARLDAQVVLRIEDHDAQRSRASYEAGILDDLDWLGFSPDVYPTDAFRAGACASRQSDRGHLYASAASALAARGLIYGCTCTRQDLERAGSSGGGAGRRYPGTCRDRDLPPTDDVAWRLRLDPGVESFADLLHGPQVSVPAATHGDLVIRDRHGNWTYTFAVVVDDFDQQVDVVIRGDDLREATADQVRLGRMIGRQTPARFAHHGVLMKSPTQKLSKADGDSGIRELRRAGWTSVRVIGTAAAMAGLTGPAAIAASDVAELFADRQGPEEDN
jgi:glutamyl-tRNA synthetase/glutamyl-Q tRNA(Asp) synthetase